MNQFNRRPEPVACEIRAIFAPVQRRLAAELRENQYDQADLVRRTTEDWRDFVANLDRAAAHLDD